MFAWEKHVKVWQLVGAILTVPAGIAGTYSVYRNYVAGGVSCSDLRGSIIAVLDKNLAPDVKRRLLREDVEKFDKNCGDKDPDARAIFQAAVSSDQFSQPAAKSVVVNAPVAIFGLSRTGEKRGWVQLVRRDGEGKLHANFDGVALSVNTLPVVGTVLTTVAMLPVWLEPPSAGQPSDASALQGRLARGSCVKVLSRGPAGRPFWAEVAPEACPPRNN